MYHRLWWAELNLLSHPFNDLPYCPLFLFFNSILFFSALILCIWKIHWDFFHYNFSSIERLLFFFSFFLSLLFSILQRLVTLIEKKKNNHDNKMIEEILVCRKMIFFLLWLCIDHVCFVFEYIWTWNVQLIRINASRLCEWASFPGGYIYAGASVIHARNRKSRHNSSGGG